jgi:hypothetical protein
VYNLQKAVIREFLQCFDGFRLMKGEAKLFVKTSASPALVEEAWKETLATSPVANTLSRNVTIVPQISVAR